MTEEPHQCPRCGEAQPIQAFDHEGAVCRRCRLQAVYRRLASEAFSLLHERIVAVPGGYRAARELDGDFFGWLCPHVHPDSTGARNLSGARVLARAAIMTTGAVTREDGQ
jgi:hypothetical protein